MKIGSISAYWTMRCLFGCDFCLCRSGPNGADIPMREYEQTFELVCCLISSGQIELAKSLFTATGGGEPNEFRYVNDTMTMALNGGFERCHLMTAGASGPAQLARLAASPLIKVAQPDIGYWPITFSLNETKASVMRLAEVMNVVPILSIRQWMGSDPDKERRRLQRVLDAACLGPEIEGKVGGRRGYVRGGKYNVVEVQEYGPFHTLGRAQDNGIGTPTGGRVLKPCQLASLMEMRNPDLRLMPAGISPCWNPEMAKWPLSPTGLMQFLEDLPVVCAKAEALMMKQIFFCDRCPLASAFPDKR